MRRYLILTAVLSLISLSACSVMPIRTVRGSGNVVTETREVDGFDRITISGIGTLFIEQGDTETLEIEAEDNIMPYLESEVRTSTLELGVQTPGVNLQPSERIEYRLTVIDLREVEASGTADIHINELSTEHFEIEISGLGDVTVNALTAVSVRTDVSGAGDVYVAGTAPDQEVHISGVGSYEAGDLRSETVELEMSGSGSAEVWAEDRLDVRISGVGNVRYYGSPVVQQRISGLGNLTQLGER